jgi:hypothetical protein
LIKFSLTIACHQSGKIVLHNLLQNRSLMTFIQDAGLVSALSFRTGLPCGWCGGSWFFFFKES